VSTVIVAATASAAKTMASTSRAIGLRLCFIDGQRSSAQFGPVERRDRFVGFSGIGHFGKPETT
jgi:hypothetical protein